MLFTLNKKKEGILDKIFSYVFYIDSWTIPKIRYETNIPRKQTNNFVGCLLKNIFILCEFIIKWPAEGFRSCMAFGTKPDGNKSSFAAIWNFISTNKCFNKEKGLF